MVPGTDKGDSSKAIIAVVVIPVMFLAILVVLIVLLIGSCYRKKQKLFVGKQEFMVYGLCLVCKSFPYFYCSCS